MFGVWRYAHVDAMERVARNICYGFSTEEHARLCWKGLSYKRTRVWANVRMEDPRKL